MARARLSSEALGAVPGLLWAPSAVLGLTPVLPERLLCAACLRARGPVLTPLPTVGGRRMLSSGSGGRRFLPGPEPHARDPFSFAAAEVDWLLLCPSMLGSGLPDSPIFSQMSGDWRGVKMSVCALSSSSGSCCSPVGSGNSSFAVERPRCEDPGLSSAAMAAVHALAKLGIVCDTTLITTLTRFATSSSCARSACKACACILASCSATRALRAIMLIIVERKSSAPTSWSRHLPILSHSSSRRGVAIALE
mmetsp:Transcript_22625/g.73558  ORF Transcript_22625/g.73558 Transcript_22625/m.73558 type:complete len:251 (-) Transcript_22625:89-841(-)